ncbi:MAG TPA: hypothetical protein VNR11_17200 [Xanthobacteraceae bacterium]|nr:hypothetical protein [Xanthobacteraceae bacterium]
MRTRTTALLIAAGLSLAGCLDQKAEEIDPNLFPADYKKEVIETVMKLLDDPTNIREAAISEPVLQPVGGVPRYVGCVRFNPRNYNHDYIGLVERIGYYYGGHLNQLLKAEPGQCSFATYQPFPELEKICLGKKCE